MQILLKRVAMQATYTQGYLFIDNEYFCDTLEARVFVPNRDRRDARGLALPKGRYRVSMHYSGRYKRVVPVIYLSNGKDHKFHHGSKPKDAKGIIVGKNAAVGWIENSTDYLQKLNSKIHHAINGGESVILVIK